MFRPSTLTVCPYIVQYIAIYATNLFPPNTRPLFCPTQSLSLEACKNTIIGGVFSFPRGVSGGERKRVSVAVELLTKPSVLLLDEPTSGLDSTVANKLVAMLSRLAKGDDTPGATSTTPASRTNQRTVIMTIHQPSQRVVTSFDVTLFLAKGERAYYGSARGIFPYFRNELNLNPPWGTNPAEFALDVCNGNVDGFGVETGVDGGQVVENVLAASAARTARIGDDGAEEGTLSSKDAYEGTSTGTTGGVTTTHASSPSPPPPDNRKFATTWFRQITVLSKRALSARRGAFFDALKISQILFVAFLVGALWWRRGTEVGLDSVGDLSGVLFFELLFLSFLTLFNSLFTFPDEKAVALKERQSGVIRVSSYFVARTAVDGTCLGLSQIQAHCLPIVQGNYCLLHTSQVDCLPIHSTCTLKTDTFPSQSQSRLTFSRPPCSCPSCTGWRV